MVLPKAGLSSELQPSSRFVTFVRWDRSQPLIPRLRQYLKRYATMPLQRTLSQRLLTYIGQRLYLKTLRGK
jgi:hypothetical protein